MQTILALVLASLVAGGDLQGRAGQRDQRDQRGDQRRQQSGPWQNDLLVRSFDDDKFGNERAFVERAGVPSVVRAKDGTLYAAFQWFPDGNQEAFDKVAVTVSKDAGATWSPPKPAVFGGMTSNYQRPFDPTLVVLEDGRIRMYFTSSPTARPGPNAITAIYSAISTDGFTYTFEPGRRLFVPGKRVIDCAVLELGKTWHMIAPIGRPEDGAYHAVSENGLDFRRVDDIASRDGVNWTGNLVHHGEGMRFYGTSRRGVWWSYSSDGAKWTDPSYLSFAGGDPTYVSTGENKGLLVYVSRPRR